MGISIKQKLVRRIFSKYAATQANIHNLSYLFWECTLRCNLNCLHCGSDCKKESEIDDMPIADFVEVLKNIRTKYKPGEVMIVLTGGEPLMRKDLEDCGRKISELGFPWGMVSNGFLLTRERFENLVKSGLRAITVSMDGLEENHNWLRGNKKSYEGVEKALDIIATNDDVVHDVVTCVNRRNIKELEHIRQYLNNKGIKAWRLFTIAPIGRAIDYEDLNLNAEEIRYLFDYIRKCRSSNEIKVSFSCEAYAGDYDHEIRDGLFFCRAGINIGSVLLDGSVSACPNNCTSLIQGNIYQDDFLSIWEKKFTVMRDRKWMKTGICADCKDYKFCNGGAMHLRECVGGETLTCLNEKISRH